MNIKLLLPSIVLSLAIGALGLISYNALNGTVNQYSRIANETLPNIQDSEEMFLAFRKVRIELRTLGLKGITREKADIAVKGVLEGIAEFEAAEKAYVAREFIDGEEVLYKPVHEKWTEFKKLGERVLALYAAGEMKDQEEMLGIFLNDCPIIAAEMLIRVTGLIEFHKENGKKWSDQAQYVSKTSKQQVLWMSVIGILIGLGLAIYSMISVRTLMNAIRSAVNAIRQGTESVTEVSNNLTVSSTDLSAGATQQAAAVQETSSALEETSSMTQKNAENAERCQEIAIQSRSSAERGKTSMDDVRNSMTAIEQSNERIAAQVAQSQQEMMEIVKVIQEIGSKTRVINEIVFQTKLLSFNASVEAARAGEHGKGFAVVAEEVGNLATMSGSAAKEISDLLDISTKKVQEIAASAKEKTELVVSEAKENITAGASTANSCSEILESIVGNAITLADVISEITTASKEQTNGIQEINKAIVEIDAGASSVSAVSSKTSVDAQTLNSQIKILSDELDRLSKIIGMKKEELANVTTIPTRGNHKKAPSDHAKAA